MKKITVAIDGFSSCGKSTLAKDLADKLSYVYVDSGAMYRAVALYLLDQGVLKEDGSLVYDVKDFLNDIELGFEIDKESNKSLVTLNGEIVESKIRNLRISKVVSKIAAIKEVRKKLVSIQKNLGINKGVVMDGRDIGTVVFPDAELKLFMTADTVVRAQRRYEELKAKGQEISLDKVQQNLLERDRIDTQREESPLVRAEDAIILDNSQLSKAQQLNYVLHLAEAEIFKLNNVELYNS